MKGFGRFGGGTGMTDLRLHAILFAMVLVAAVLTWSREVTYGEDAEAVRVWDRDTTDILAIAYRVGDVEVRIERRTDQAGDYLWGTERVGGDEPRTTEFPVGPPGHGLLGRVAGLRTIRDLGTRSAELKTRFGIEGSSDRLAVRFRDENRELILGDKVYGAEQRYAHEPATGVGYILPREVMTVLANGQGAIRERWVNRFPSEDLVRVRVLLGGTVRTMARIGDSGEWADPGSAVADVAFGSFMQRVAELAIEGFAERPGPNSRVLVRVDYLGSDDEPLGFMELLRDDDREAHPYFIVTETTRVPAQAMTFLAQRVEEGLPGVLSGVSRAPSARNIASAEREPRRGRDPRTSPAGRPR